MTNVEKKKCYFIDDTQVSEQRYIEAERNVGFFPKSGTGPATGGFSGSNGVKGSVRYL